ncbi:S8 family serine peptidase [bacterium]|nr:S8 family serine peptidase [bacterium]
MSEREYIVSLNKDVDYDAFNAEMIASTGAGNTVPERAVEVANARPASQRNTHYSLTDAEAELLKTDSRVYGVTLLPELDPDLSIGFDSTQTGNFTKTTLDRGDFLNWGMRRMNAATNPYTGVAPGIGGYDFTLDGTGVDVVIMDSGLQIDHPEFQDANGASRVQQIDWTTESGIAGMPAQSANYYRDYDGHGTHVAGTATGKTYGWAKNAKIYVLKLSGLEGAGDSGTGTGTTYAFDCIKEWHLAKPVDASTGVKRPTIVNMSWGYLRYYDSVSNMTYRGDLKSGTDIDTPTKRHAFGLVPIWNGARYMTNTRVASVDTDMEELIDAGVHVCVAAGNRSHKIDVAAGLDYDNYATANTGGVYYHRGSSPYSARAHIVGNVDSSAHSGGLEQKAVSSEAGPGVSIFAPGTDIMSAMSTTNKFGATTLNNPYPSNSTFLINNISGTSMASPQVAGALALWTQINPGSTPAQALAYMNVTAKPTKLYDTASTTDYSTDRSLLGATNRFAFNKFNSPIQLRIGETTSDQAGSNPATYSLSSSVANVNEGSQFTITLTTTNIVNGTNIPYTITGVSSADINGASLTGVFVVQSSTASITYTTTADASTEGAETFILSLDALSTTQSVTINDTSVTPPTYSVAPTTNNVNEGVALTFNVTTTNVSDATTLYWTVTSASDFSTSSGSFNITSNTGSFAVTPTADATTEGAETFTAQVRTSGIAGAIVATSAATTINDTSTGSGAPSYGISVSDATINEGESTTFTLSTSNVADSTQVPYTITGVSEADLDQGVRRSGALANMTGYGSNFFTKDVTARGVRVVAAGDVGGQAAIPDAFTEKVAKTIQFFTEPGGDVVEATQDTFIKTLSGETGTYHAGVPTLQRVARGQGVDYTPNFLSDAGIMSWGLTPLFDSHKANDMVWYLNASGTPGDGDNDAAEVIEHVFHTLHMFGLPARDMKLYPGLDSDFKSGPAYLAMKQAIDNGKFDPSAYASAWDSDNEIFEVALKEYLYLLNFAMFDYTSLWDGGSLTPEWTDDMRTPAGVQSNNPLGYALHNTYIATAISKPSLATIRSLFQDGDVGDPTQAGASNYVADTAISLTGNFTVNSGTSTLTLNVSPDKITDGAETLALALDNGEASQNVTITDSSITQGPTYYTFPAALTVNEGAGLQVNIVTTGVADATALYWTINSNAGDFSAANGTATVTSGNANFTVTPTADATTEGSETFTVSIRTGSVSGTVVATTAPVTIADTSLTPDWSPDYTINVSFGGSGIYTLSGTDRNGSVSGSNPPLTFENGDNVQFNNAANTGHPLYIKTVQGTGTGNQAGGVVGQGTATLEWTVSSTGTFYYQCSIHNNMHGDVTITEAGGGSINQSTVIVANGTNILGTGNKYYISTEGAVAAPVISLTEGQTYRFNQSDSTNSSHQLRFSTTSNGTHGGGSEYTTGVTKVGTAGQAGAYTQIVVASGAPTLHYYCVNHANMGNQANT